MGDARLLSAAELRDLRRAIHSDGGSWPSADADRVIGALLDHIDAIEQQSPGGHHAVSHPEAYPTSVPEGET